MTENKRGSVTVFICIFFVSLVFMILVFVDASKKTAAGSAAQSLSILWGESILAEYDLNLKNRYNLFGFYGSPPLVKEKLEFYGSESFDEKRYIDWAVTGCSLYNYSLVSADIMETQLAEAGKLAFTEKFIRPDPEIRPVEKAGGGQDFAGEDAIFSDLPSEGSSKAYSFSKVTEILTSCSSIQDAFEKTGKSWFVNQYLFSYLKDVSNDRGLGKTYLNGEIEYVICGKKSDEANRKAVRNRIVAAREAANLLYIAGDVKKNAEAMAAAQLLTPGPAAALTQKAILAAWALAESINDYKLLINGCKVPVMKSEASWAVDLGSVLENKADGYIDPRNETGETYEDYLKLFTYTMDSRVRVLRVMDIIQINMRHLYYSGFRLKDYHAGLDFTLSVNGETYGSTQTYEKDAQTGRRP